MAASSSQITGVNAGFLWNVGDAGSIYLVNPHGSCSPFDNPKFVEAFNRAQTIAFKTSTLTQEKLGELFDSAIEKCAKKSKKYLTDDRQVEALNEKLQQLLVNSSAQDHFLKEGFDLNKINLAKFEDLHQRFTALLFACLFFTQMPANKSLLDETLYTTLRAKSLEVGKTVVSLFNEDKTAKRPLKIFKTLFETPAFYTYIEDWILSEGWEEKMQAYHRGFGHAWDLGFFQFRDYDSRPEKEEEKKLDAAFEKRCGTSYSLMKDLTQLKCRELELDDRKEIFKLGEKVEALAKTGSQYMVITSDSEGKELFSNLTKRNIVCHGPLRESMKPIGFLWEIRKVNTVVGHFLGSVHIVPQWILDNFNSKTLEAFGQASVLGVEVDVTREEVANSLKSDPMDFFFPGYSTDSVTRYAASKIIKEGLKIHQIVIEETDPQFIEKGLGELLKIWTAEHGVKGGIDLHFIQKAKDRNMEIVNLESVEIHQEFGDLSVKEAHKTFPVWWKYEDFKSNFTKALCEQYPEMLEMGMIELLEGRQQTDEHAQAMNRRNMEMALSTDRLIRQGKIPFSIAGAGHFAGKMGMQRLMEGMGYTVTQIVCEEPREAAVPSASS